MEPVADLRPCEHCGNTDRRRMIALMRLWYGRYAGAPADGGYFYLCPRCYDLLIEPHAGEIVQRLVEQHPFLHRQGAQRHYHPAPQATSATPATVQPEAMPATPPTVPAQATSATPPAAAAPPAGVPPAA